MLHGQNEVVIHRLVVAGLPRRCLPFEASTLIQRIDQRGVCFDQFNTSYKQPEEIDIVRIIGVLAG